MCSRRLRSLSGRWSLAQPAQHLLRLSPLPCSSLGPASVQLLHVRPQTQPQPHRAEPEHEHPVSRLTISKPRSSRQARLTGPAEHQPSTLQVVEATPQSLSLSMAEAQPWMRCLLNQKQRLRRLLLLHKRLRCHAKRLGCSRLGARLTHRYFSCISQAQSATRQVLVPTSTA